MNAAPAHQHISPSGIAKLTGVSTSTVSNWRTRYEDFPEATAGTEARPLFSLPAVLKWLQAKNKPIKQNPDRPDFALASSLRGIVPAETMVPILLPLLCWAKYSRDPETQLAEDCRFPFASPVADPLGALESAGTAFRFTGQTYISSALFRAGEMLENSPRGLESVLEHVGALLWEVDPHVVAEQLITADAERLRGGLATFMTPPALSQLLVRSLGAHAATIADLACGAGQTLLDAHTTHSEAQLYGNDQLANAVELTACRLYLADVPAQLAIGDALEAESTFDAVILHGPFGSLHGEQKALAAQLPFGGVTGSKTDLAWALVAYRALKPGGRATVVLPHRALSRTRSSNQVLPRMIAEGVVEAIIALPADIQRYAKVASYIVVLHRPAEPTTPDNVLLIDLSQHSGSRLPDAVIDETITALNTWRHGEPVQHPSATTAPTAKLLSPDASLAPQDWLHSTQPVDAQQLLDRFERAQAELQNAEHAIESLSAPSTALRALDTAAETYPIGNAFTRHRGTAQIHRHDTDPDAEAVEVLTPRAVATGNAERLPITLPDSSTTTVTRSGQVAVTIHAGRITARVWENEGLPVSRDVTILDINPTTHDADFVAHLLMADINQATINGQLAPRIKVENLRLPRLPLETQREAGAAYKQLRLATEAATKFAEKAQALLTTMSNTVATGQFTIH